MQAERSESWRSFQLAFTIAVTACRSSGTDPASHPGSAAIAASGATDASTAHGRFALPEVIEADAIVVPSGPTPLLVVVDMRGKVAFAAGPAWDALATYDPTGASAVDDLDAGAKLLNEGRGRHLTPAEIVARLHPSDAPVVLRDPAEPDDADDDHLALALDVGKMGKTNGGVRKPRTEHDTNVDTAGGFGGEVGPLGTDSGSGWGGDLDLRRASVAGEVVDKLAPAQHAVVLADLHANARAMIAAVMMSRGLIGVSHGGGVAVLRIQFLDFHSSRPDEYWADLKVGGKLEFRPQNGGKTVILADNAALETAYKAAHLDPYRVVDVLVAPDVDAQRLVGVIVTLERAGARAIGLGNSK